VATVAVVGAGVGGLAASIHLAAAGHDVVVLERLDRAGGKLAEHRAAGFTWETGPSLLTLPHVFRDLAAVAGRSLDELVTLRRLDPICRYRFPDGTTFDHRADLEDAAAAAEELAPGSGREWRSFMARARSVWEVSERSFFAGAMSSPLELLGRMRSPRDLLAIDPLRSLHARASSSFSDPRLVQYVDRYATYSGSSPFRAPATMSCIAHIEQSLGAWYVDGGLGRLSDALVELAVGVGVEIRTGVDVEGIDRRDGAVSGVRLAGGGHLAADAVVANVDALHLYRDLLPHDRRRRRAEAAPRSSSGFVLLLGVEGETPGLAHHNISFSPDHRAEFDQLFDAKVAATDPTVYVCAASTTDPAQAPEGHEGWFLLVNAPEGAGDMAGYGDHLLDVLAGRGWDLAGRLVHREQLTPADFESRFRTPGGAIYGTSSNGRMAAFLRPGNRGPIDRLYLCGGSSHPGGGLPLVAMSGTIAAGLCAADLRGR
jgi:phytoene desaturase